MNLDRRTFIGASAALVGVAQAARATTRKSGGGRAQRKALSNLEDYVEAHRADWGIPGMTACVVDLDGFQGFVMSGAADVDRDVAVGPEHLFQVGSITKMMTALAAWSLIDDGVLSPDDRLTALLPELTVKDGADITLQHLLNHTSGLPRGAPPISDGGLWTGFAPGTQWAYSNLGYKLAGMIVAKAHGGLFPEAVEARVLKPLGMTASIGAMYERDRALYAQGYHPALMDRPAMRPSAMVEAPWVNYDGASGCVASTASDMALFLRFLLDLANGSGAPLFSDSTAARFMADPADAPGWAEGVKYGNGIAQFEKDGRTYLHHTGGMVSFSSSLHVDAAAGVAAFASANVHYGLNYRPRDVTVRACELIRAAREDGEASSPAPTKPHIENPAPFAGRFTAKDGDSFEIIAGDDKIHMRRDGTDSAMQPIGEAYFACADEAFEFTGLEFDIEEDRAVRAWAGGIEYLSDPSIGYRAEAPAALKAHEGRYDNDDRWSIPVRVFAREDGLVVKSANYLTKLTALDNGDWRPSDKEWWPDWARFDGYLNGKPQRLLFSGVPYYRRFS